jgi:ankyrin repeat protein
LDLAVLGKRNWLLKRVLIYGFLAFSAHAMGSMIVYSIESDLQFTLMEEDLLLEAVEQQNSEFLNKYISLMPETERGILNKLLHHAAYCNQLAIIKLLLRYGADLHALNEKRESILHAACLTPRPSPILIKFLIGEQVDASLADVKGQTALHIAAGRGLWFLLDFLPCTKQSLSISNDRGRTPLHVAVLRGKDHHDLPSLVSMVSRKVGRNDSALETARILLNNGADLTVLDGFGESAVYYAAAIGDIDLVQLFIQHQGRLTNTADTDGRTPYTGLFFAYRALSAETRRLGFLRMKAYPFLLSDIIRSFSIMRGRVRNGKNQTILHFACMQGKDAAVQELVKLHVPINSSDMKKRTPLHYTTMGGFKECVATLLAHKVGATYQDIYGRTALHYALLKGYWTIARMLCNYASKAMLIRDNSSITPRNILADKAVADPGIESEDFKFLCTLTGIQ